MQPIRVIVRGAIGKMGREVCIALSSERDFKLVGAVVSPRQRNQTRDINDIGGGFQQILVSDNLEFVIKQCQPDVMVDFTRVSEAMHAIQTAAHNKLNQVIGTTGFSNNDITEMKKLAESLGVGILLVPNFALGAVLMMHLSSIAARYMENGEIIELHHNRKTDAPSGTALTTASTMVQTSVNMDSLLGGTGIESRGEVAEGVSVHSVRMPGLMAHQEVVLGATGQLLSIKHDIYSSECYIKGVLFAIKQAVFHKGFTYGLDKLLDL